MNEATNVSAQPEQPAFHELGSVPFSGRPDALFERHLLSDAVVEPSTAYDRQRFEARDLLSRRWIKTRRTYDQKNPKRIYCMSMEFLIGLSLANNVKNLMRQPFIERTQHEGSLDWLGLVEQEPDAGLGNGGLGRLAACAALPPRQPRLEFVSRPGCHPAQRYPFHSGGAGWPRHCWEDAPTP